MWISYVHPEDRERGRPVTGASGNPERYIGVVIDITEGKRAEKALRKAEERERQKREELETVLAALPAAVLIAKDAACLEIIGNPAAYELLQVPPGTNLSKSVPADQSPGNYELFQDGRRLAPPELPLRKAAAKYTFSGEEIEIRFADGRRKFLLSNAFPLFDSTGNVRGAVATHADITKLKRTEEALRKSEERLKFALDAANAGTWEVALETGELAASEGMLSLLGIAPGTPVTHDIALASVHPDDQARLDEGLRHTLETGEPYRAEWRALLPDGSTRWREIHGERRFISGKQVVGGLVQDINERKRVEQCSTMERKRSPCSHKAPRVREDDRGCLRVVFPSISGTSVSTRRAARSASGRSRKRQRGATLRVGNSSSASRLTSRNAERAKRRLWQPNRSRKLRSRP